MDRVRLWGDASPVEVRAFLASEAALLRARYLSETIGAQPPVSDILSISGGADDGAFSAGLIVGWGQSGSRPTFDAVTGISAGSLVAPFAFLGQAYDRKLASVFTTHEAGEIYSATPLAAVFGGPALADNTPLAKLIESYVDRPMLDAIARERQRGRYLFIGTTNLHAQRPVFWDMGRIAGFRNAAALQLFRDVLLASAAVPGVFPPVQVTVVGRGQTFAEVHVDGGPTREVFLSPTGFSFRDIDALTGLKPQRRVWVIRNGKLTPEYEAVDLTASAIAVRSLATLTKNQGLGDLNRIYDRARADGMEFRLASIPTGFNAQRTVPFDGAYMRALYAEGLRFGRAQNNWVSAPPQATTRRS
jgi:hypothetical protein